MTPTMARADTGSEDAGLYEALYHQAPCGYLSTALDGTILRVNDTFLGWTGHDRSSLVGRRRFAELLAPGDRAFYETHQLAQLERAGELGGVALDVCRADGSTFPVLLSSVIVDAAPDRPVIRTTVFDATERRSYEDGLRIARERAEASEQRLRALQRVTEACAAARSVQELVDGVSEAAVGVSLRIGTGTGERGGDGDGEVVVDGSTVHAAVRTEGGSTAELVWRPAGGGAVEDDDLALIRTAAVQVAQALQRLELHDALERRAHRDDLTGLANRALLRDRFELAVARAARAGTSTALLLVDLDDFKAVNDRYGHAHGDRTLVEVARRLRALVRPEDTVARIGGDEFAVLCEGTGREAADLVASRIALDLGRGTEVGASVGVAVLAPGAADDLDALLQRADAAMYERKRLRRLRR
ncbi:MAG TPA: diguanylate cyclase [Acidimicrobiales bacterium]|nr:diguanylate cyclase [Acidimicrobiales bacterium]